MHIATLNVNRVKIFSSRFGEIVKWCIDRSKFLDVSNYSFGILPIFTAK